MTPSLFVIHCSDTPNGKWFDSQDILRWHTLPPPRGNGWKKGGYHWVITPDGRLERLVDLDDDDQLEPWEIANGAKGYNGRSIHACMIGRDAFSWPQWDQLESLRYRMERQFPGIQTVGHHDLNPAKTCPGFDVAEWLANGPHPADILLPRGG